MIQRLLFLLFLSTILVNSMLIYRPKQTRPKLVCYAVLPDAQKQQQRSDKMDSSTIMAEPNQKVHMRRAGLSTSNDLQSHPLMSVVRARRNAEDFDEFNFDNGFDIDIVGASLSDQNRDKIRKKLIRTCEALKSHPI